MTRTINLWSSKSFITDDILPSLPLTTCRKCDCTCRKNSIEIPLPIFALRNTEWAFLAIPGTDSIGIVQIEQDVPFCQHKFPSLAVRPVAVQFKKDEEGEVIVMFELELLDGEIRKLQERQYQLVPASAISAEDIRNMAAKD